MCGKVVKDDFFSLRYVPDYFVTHNQLKIWYYEDDCCSDDELNKCYKGYQKRKSQKAQIKEELCLMLGIHQGGGIGVLFKTRKKRHKNCF